MDGEKDIGAIDGWSTAEHDRRYVLHLRPALCLWFACFTSPYAIAPGSVAHIVDTLRM
ncbi:MAG: hypothetical protein ACREV0_04115 [Burkholderiales bacterium]